jgi:hypothetical protein
LRDFANSWVLQLIAPLVSLRKLHTAAMGSDGTFVDWTGALESLSNGARTGSRLSFEGIYTPP